MHMEMLQKDSVIEIYFVWISSLSETTWLAMIGENVDCNALVIGSSQGSTPRPTSWEYVRENKEMEYFLSLVGGNSSQNQ